MVSFRYGVFLTVFTALTLSACSSTVTYRGFQETQKLTESVQPGVSTKQALLSRFGSPSLSGNAQTGDSWYYVAYTEEKFAFFHPEITDRDVVALYFDQNGVLETSKHYSLADGKIISLNDDKTPLYGKDLNVVQQLLSNVGRFNTDDTSNPGSGVLGGRRPGGL